MAKMNSAGKKNGVVGQKINILALLGWKILYFPPFGPILAPFWTPRWPILDFFLELPENAFVSRCIHKNMIIHAKFNST